MTVFRIDRLFYFFAVKNHFPCSPAGGSMKRNGDTISKKNCLCVSKYMHQSVANTAQLAPRTNLIRILKYFKNLVFLHFFQKNENHGAKYFAGAANFH